MALATCRVHVDRRLAQSVGRDLGIHLGRAMFHPIDGSCDMHSVHVHFDCAGSRKSVVPVLAYGLSPGNFRAKLLL